MAKFVTLYLGEGPCHRNATESYAQSYGKGGNKRRTSTTEGCRLLKHPRVREAIDAFMAEAAEKLEVSAKNTLRELARIAFLDPRRFFNADNTIKGMLELDDEAAHAVSKIEVEELFEGKGDDKVWVGYTKKLAFWNKNDSLNTLARHLKLLEEGEFDPDAVGKGVVAIPPDMTTDEWIEKYKNANSPTGKLDS